MGERGESGDVAPQDLSEGGGLRLAHDGELPGRVDDGAVVLAQLHRLNGGCAYSGVPGLQRLLSQLEQQLRDGVAVSELEPELLELQDAMEQVRREAPLYLA